MSEKIVVPALTTQLLMKAFAVCGSVEHLAPGVEGRLELQEGNEGAELERLVQRLDRIDRRPEERNEREDRRRDQQGVDHEAGARARRGSRGY